MPPPRMTESKRPAHNWAFLLALALSGLSYLLVFPFIGHLGMLVCLAVYVLATGRLYRYVERH